MNDLWLQNIGSVAVVVIVGGVLLRASLSSNFNTFQDLLKKLGDGQEKLKEDFEAHKEEVRNRQDSLASMLFDKLVSREILALKEGAWDARFSDLKKDIDAAHDKLRYVKKE